ncbi:hypothetical protein WJX79_001193 [Trebouxia sp. C0005]
MFPLHTAIPHMYMDMPPNNENLNGQRSDMSRLFTPPSAHAASSSPMGWDLITKSATEAGKASVAAGHAPVTNTGGTERRTAIMTDCGAASKKSGSLARVKKRSAKARAMGVAYAAGRGSRKRKTDGSEVHGDASTFDLDAVLSGMPEDLGMDTGMDNDGSTIAELAAGFTAPCLSANPL